MAYTRQWVVATLTHLGYTKAAEAAQELPEEVSHEELTRFGDQHGIDLGEMTNRMGGSP
jgi:hypothetical protein